MRPHNKTDVKIDYIYPQGHKEIEAELSNNIWNLVSIRDYSPLYTALQLLYPPFQLRILPLQQLKFEPKVDNLLNCLPGNVSQEYL